MTAEESGFLKALKKNPKDAAASSAYADWLDENGRPYEAALQREKAGLSEVFFKIRRKSDRLFSSGTRSGSYRPLTWSAKGKMWRTLSALHAHLRGPRDTRTYSGIPWEDVEVVFLEVRVTYTTTLGVAQQKHPRARGSGTTPTVVEPLRPAPAAEE
jgi:uncharacterized protein (TIGR02996 family)